MQKLVTMKSCKRRSMCMSPSLNGRQLLQDFKIFYPLQDSQISSRIFSFLFSPCFSRHGIFIIFFPYPVETEIKSMFVAFPAKPFSILSSFSFLNYYGGCYTVVIWYNGLISVPWNGGEYCTAFNPPNMTQWRSQR